MRRGIKANRLMDFWLGVPILNTLATLRGRRSWPISGIKRVGILSTPALGDVLLSSAAIQDLRAHFDCVGQATGPVELVHFCMKPNLAAAELIPGIDRRLLIDLKKPAETIRILRSERLDVLVDLSPWQRLTAFYTMMSGARFTAGFLTPGQYRGRGYDLIVEHGDDRHEVDHYRALLKALGISVGAAPQIEVPTVEVEPLAGERDVVVFHLWASGIQSWIREWPDERWVALARRVARPETIFAITGAPSDLKRSNPFVKQLEQAGLRATAFVGTDGFVSLAHLLRRARVVVSVNTGVMHLAAILGAPTVSINGPNRNSRWGPVGPRAIGVESPGEGCGYLHLGFDFDGRPTDCMQRITVDMVESAIAEVVQR